MALEGKVFWWRECLLLKEFVNIFFKISIPEFSLAPYWLHHFMHNWLVVLKLGILFKKVLVVCLLERKQLDFSGHKNLGKFAMDNM